MTDSPLEQILARAPDSAPYLEALSATGVLSDRSPEDDSSTLTGLAAILIEPRFPGCAPHHVYWGLLERLFNPYSNTQLVNVPFSDGSLHAMTCVSAARVFKLISKHAAEYVRVVRGLTSPHVSFQITRTYAQPALLARKRAWLAGRFPYEDVAPATLRITVRPDAHAAERALLEHRRRLFPEYDFGSRERKNSRLLIDVLLQSALTNYALGGSYDSHADASGVDGSRGVAYTVDGSDEQFGRESLDNDIVAAQRTVVLP